MNNTVTNTGHRSFLALLLTVFLIAGCQDQPSVPSTGTVRDIDGNTYRTVTIGRKVWMAENLKVSRYRNGDPVWEVHDSEMWRTMTSGAWCNYDNNTGLDKIYGKLYNGYAVNNPRNIAPEGWHVATDEEWKELAGIMGGEDVAGGRLKAVSAWQEPNAGADNSSGFTAMPGGARRDTDGQFVLLGKYARFWAAGTETGKLHGFALGYHDESLRRGEVNERIGFSVRCVRD
jgi:uncharacterized protein (TIGR02145 family)